MDFQAVLVGLLVTAIVAFVGGGIAVLVKLARMDERHDAMEARVKRCEDRLDAQDKYLHEHLKAFAKDFQAWRHDFIREKVEPHLDKVSLHELKIDRIEQRLNRINGETKQ